MIYKVITFVPEKYTELVISAMSAAGAGNLGTYTQCAFITHGTGHWFSGPGSHPAIGSVGKRSREPENKLEMLTPPDCLNAVIQAIYTAHPYESPEIDIVELVDTPPKPNMSGK